MFQHRLAPLDVLSEESMDVLWRGWRRLASDLGIQFQHEGALERFRQAGQRVEGDIVRFDPDFLLAQAALAPTRFRLRARNPAREVEFAPDHMVMTPVQSAPFVRDGAVRRDGTFADFCRLVRLTHLVPELDTPGYPVCEATDLDPETRHLQMQLALITESDKPYGAAQFDPVGCADSVAMAAMVHGGLEALAERPALYGIINVNSPLRYDGRMVDSLFVLAEARQVVVVTPFILMGAMGPVSLPAALAQGIAEALAGIALAQLISPGCPVVLGQFTSHTDMQSGSPGLGGPEAALGLLASGQVARRLGLLWRAGGGGLTSSQLVDAQAAFESVNTMLPAMLGGANLALHVAGWLESGLVTSYDKFMVDVEALRILQREMVPLEITEADLAYDAHEEVGHGGYFFGAQHTLARFRDCFYRPMTFSTENFARWQRNGGLDTAGRAGLRWRELLETYERPPLDDGLRDELEAYASRRRAEIERDL